MVRLLGLVFLVMVTTQAMAADSIQQAAKTCIKVVHDSGYALFDAFYNPATKVVENNVAYVYQKPALFPFNKCMAQQGFPLSY